MAISTKRKSYLKEYAKSYKNKHREKILDAKLKYYHKNKERICRERKQWRIDHKDEWLEYHRKQNNKWNRLHPEKKAEQSRRYVIKHRKEVNQLQRKWYKKQMETNPAYREKMRNKGRLDREKMRNKNYCDREAHMERVRHYAREWHKKQMAISPNYRIGKSMGSSIRQALKGNKGGRKWEKLVGYTVEDLKNHLQCLFSKGMNWKNYGKNGWSIDHIIPQSLFEYSSCSDDEFKQCWSLCNLQPMWERDNLQKSNKISSWKTH